MFGRRWRLFRLRGIPISLDASWLIILALLTLSIASLFPTLMREYFGDAAPALPPYAYWFMGLIAALAFFGCILLHEMGHAIVARSRGMSIRGITLFLFGGVAELEDEPPSAATEFLMAIAGPTVSVLLGIGFALLTGIGYYGGWTPPVLMVLGYLALINLLVLAFNLIPAFPLDGGRVFRSILWAATGDLRRATLWASRAGQAFAWLLIFWGVMQFFTGNWLGGIWTGLIGLFLNNAAQSSYQQVLIRQALHGEPVRRFMNGEPIVVPPALDLRRWVEDFVYRYHHKAFPVVSDGHLEGCITTQALADIPRGQWDQHTVGEVMRHDLRTITIPPDADALDALGRMRRTGSSRLLVVERGRLIGMVSLKDLLRFLSLKIELEDSGPQGSELDGEFRLPDQRDRPAASEQLLHHGENGRKYD
ncbi:MAG TPA: site-2 protease family protein [Gemmataceae bacterium]|nr:site-2 protease family protein [Gemmataceae bacterium]